MNGPIVVAIGGNALGGGGADAAAEWRNARHTARQLVRLAAERPLIVTHGNGPQVGDVLRRSELAAPKVTPVTLDVAVAHTQGGIGFILGTALREALADSGSDRPVVAVVTETEVDPSDPAFDRPTKPVGPWLTAAQAEELQAHSVAAVRDFGTPGWRRVVPSPTPVAIVELDAIRALAGTGAVVIAAGGGGIPVTSSNHGRRRGVEAVIDKDLTSSLLAREVGAECFLIATNVRQVALHYGTPDERLLSEVTLQAARTYLDAGHFPPGSMGPKVRAMVAYVEATGGFGAISSLESIRAAAAGRAGTRFVR